MNTVAADYPERDIHVILDNLSTHKPKRDMWLARHSKVRPGAGSASDGQNWPALHPTAGAGEYQLIRRPPAALHRGYHHLDNWPGYLCNLLQC